MWAVVPYLHIQAFVYCEPNKNVLSQCGRGVEIEGLVVGVNATNKKGTCVKMPRTQLSIRSEDLVRILEGGRQLALLIGKDFPVADDVWPVVNQFHRLIDGYKLNDTWVTVITLDEREVSIFAFAFVLFFLDY